MKHPLIRTGRSLVGLTLILLGLSTYGCGDSATVTEPATLGGLSASAGLLEPKFNPATTNYTVKLFGNESSTTITASPRVAGDTIRINNQQTSSQTVTIASIGASELLSIVVTETGTGGTSRSYSVRVSREEEDTTLRDLSSSDGTLAPSPFVKAELAPSINGVGNGVTSITLTATKSDPNTVMVIDVATAPVTVPAGIASGEATIQLGGPGSDTKVPIIITGPKGGKTTYTVTIKRGASDNAFLGSLSITGGRLTFNPGRNDTPYEVSVPSGTDKVTVTGKPQDANARMTINGVEIGSQSITLLGPGQTTPITVRVTAQDGKSQQDYVISVKRAALDGNNNLKSLSIFLPGKLDFKVNQPPYNVNVASGVGSVTVTATPEDQTAKITILRSGATITSQPITLLGPGDTTPITVRVTADNGKSQDYTINVKRAALNGNTDLKSLTVSPGSLSFDPADLDYNVSLLSDVTSVRITAAPEDSAATVAINNGQPQPISLGAPGPEVRITVPVVVTAQNQKDKKTYNILFIRAALGGNFNLRSLTVTGHTLSPTFDQARTRTDYDLDVNSNVDSITVNATPQDSGASVRFLVNSAPRTNPISLPPGPSNTEIEIIVRAPNGFEKAYTIAVSRAAPSSNTNLSALRVTAGSSVTNFSSPFASNTVVVATEIINVRVTATLEDTNATLTINGQGTSSGVASAPITLGDQGSNTDIPIVVVAPSGTRKNYSITVNRAAPVPKPAKPAKPDLIDADDSCALLTGTDICFAGSHTDDLTNVIRPRFLITVREGETPHLYIDDKEDKTAEFDSEGKTMKPGFDLPDGPHKIRSTLSNAGGESPQSDVLEITINATPPGTIGG